jgi:hypothetical protein
MTGSRGNVTATEGRVFLPADKQLRFTKRVGVYPGL